MSAPEPADRHKKELGRKGEEIAAEYLSQNGYQILHTNYKIKRWGELDIIAIDDDTLVFVEVKSRQGRQMTEPFEAMDDRKIRALKRSAYRFILEQEDQPQETELPQAYRLDFVGLIFYPECKRPEIELFKNIEEW